MNAAETIAAAIEKLEELKASTATYEVQGDWLVDNVGHHTCGAGPGSGAGHEPGCGYEPLTNDPLIVTLHRTIDAQLAILKRDLDIRAKYAEEGIPLEAWESAVDRAGDLDLARAILGGAS